MKPATGKASFRRKLLLAVAATVAALVLTEVGLRVVAKLTMRERGLVYHADFGWAYLPNIEKVGADWGRDRPARTNGRGWRDEPVPLKRQAGEHRVVALGDSFTFGALVDYGERYTEVLEREIAKLEVVNLGMNAIGPDQALRVLEVEGVRYSPDVVLLMAFLGNDLNDIRFERRNSYPKPYYELDGDRLVLRPPEPGWDVIIRSSSYLGELLVRPFDRSLATSRVAPAWRDADTVPLFVALIARMRELAQEHDAKFLVVLSHGPSRHSEGYRVAAALAEAGVPTLDTVDRLAVHQARGEQLFYDDGHWTPTGHAVVGRAIRDELRRRGWFD